MNHTKAEDNQKRKETLKRTIAAWNSPIPSQVWQRVQRDMGIRDLPMEGM